MRESYSEDLANHAGPEPCVFVREDGCEALDRGMCRLSIEPRKLTYSGVPTQCNYAQGGPFISRATGGYMFMIQVFSERM